MKRIHHNKKQIQWLGQSLCLILAFHLNHCPAPCQALQANNEQQASSLTAASQLGSQEATSNINSHHLHHAQSHQPNMVSLGSESSSALESSAALAGDDLIAAESSQAPDSAPAVAEHKSFTSGAAVRQDVAQQMAASVAPQPVFVAPQMQQQAQMFQVHPQQQQHMRISPQQQQQQQAIHQQQKAAFNPFMAAALAGNYGPAQQQIAAAAAASLQRQHQHHQQHPQHLHQAQMMNPHQQQQLMQQHAHQMINPSQHQQVQQAPQQIRQHQQVAPPQQADQINMAVQESSVRSNIVPAPAMMDSNSIEMNDQPLQHQATPVGSSAPVSTGMAAASSVQHPIISPAGSGSASTELQHASSATSWPLQAPDIPKIVSLEVKCEKNLMKVSIEFDKMFNGVIFSKGHYNQGQCLHVGQNSGKQQAYFDISINSCGTQGNTQNGLYGMGGNTGSGTYFENTIVIQYDPNVQEVYDHARKLRCTWHDQYEKAVTFRPFPVDMLDIVRADFAGDNVGCWMQIQVGKGPWASEVAGIVKIGQTMTMVLAIKDEENKFDMLVRNCFAHDGKRGPIELVDKTGCITRPKLMSKFTKIKNFGSSATVLSYAHFQAFKFPDSMEVHFQCTIQICRHQCPDQCSSTPANLLGSGSNNGPGESYSESTISGTFNINGNSQVGSQNGDSVHLRKMGSTLSRERRDIGAQVNGSHHHQHRFAIKPLIQNVGLNKMIQVVSAGDLAFAIQAQSVASNATTSASENQLGDSQASSLTRIDDLSQQICMSSYNFVLSLVILALILLSSSLLAISLYLRQRSFAEHCSKGKLLVPPASPSLCGTLTQKTSPSHQTTTNSSHSHLYNHRHLENNYSARNHMMYIESQ